VTVAVSRREFLGCAVGALTMTLARSPQDVSAPTGTVRILDLEKHCALRESLAGYEAAVTGRPRVPRDVLIVPAALRIPRSAVRLIEHSLFAGGLVVLESGATFAPDDSSDFRAHRDAVRDLLVDVAPPVELWPTRGIPYVELTWPIAARVRDFSRVLPVRDNASAVIARVGELPVAMVRRVGRGMLVFLGSPIGVALWTGDREARRWLDALLVIWSGSEDSHCASRPGSSAHRPRM
jgi:hypothetical protein